MFPPRSQLIAVIGSGNATPEQSLHAREVGRSIAEAGFTVICGGLTGVMSAACQGAQEDASSGPAPRTVAILPGNDPDAANPWSDVSIATGMGHARNLVIVLSARAVVAVGGESGTLSEIAHAWQEGRPIAAYLPAGGWSSRVAGECLDGKRSDRIEPIATLDELRVWLTRIAGPTPPPGSAK